MQKIEELKNKNFKWWLGVVSCLLLFIIIIFFSYWKMSFLVKGVKIYANIAKTENPNLIIINGQAKKAIYLSVNGREILIDKAGNFYEYITLLDGLSVITLDAKDKFGNIAQKKFELYQSNNAPAIAFNGS